MEKHGYEDGEPEIPFDERFRQAEQYSLDFKEAGDTTFMRTPPPRLVDVFICPANCAICPRCDHSDNRQ